MQFENQYLQIRVIVVVEGHIEAVNVVNQFNLNYDSCKDF